MDSENLLRNRGEKGAQYLGAEQGSAPFTVGPGWLGGIIQNCQLAFFLGGGLDHQIQCPIVLLCWRSRLHEAGLSAQIPLSTLAV